MFSNRNRAILLSSIIIIFCLMGCVVKRPRIVEDDLIRVGQPVIPLNIIEKRITDNQEMLEKYDIPEEQKEIALSLVDIYRKLRTMNTENTKGPEYRAIIKDLFDSIGILEKKYLHVFDISDLESRRAIISDYSLMKKKIFENYLIGNYNGVISQCSDFERKYGKESLTEEISLILALSLAQENMVQEALSIGEQIITSMQLSHDSILLTANIVKWELERGNRQDALNYFEKLLDDINEKNALFKKTENLISEYESSDDLDTLKDLYLTESDRSKDGAAEAKLTRVEKLIKEENFAEARLLLLRWRLRAEEGPEVELIEQALKSVEAAEESLKQEDSNDKIKLDEARDLLGNEKYEDALELLESIENEALASEVNQLREKAIEKLINRKRLEAAVLFSKAKESDDINTKRTFLITSQKILENLIESYPDSILAERLRSHLDKVNDELNNLP